MVFIENTSVFWNYFFDENEIIMKKIIKYHNKYVEIFYKKD